MTIPRKMYKNGFYVDLPEYYDEFYLNGWYTNSEIETQDWIIDHFHGDWVSIDVGAHLGYYSMLMSYMAPFGVVYAFEVNEKTVEMMRTNIRYNETAHNYRFGNIFIIQTALGHRCGTFWETVWQTGKTAGNYGETTSDFTFDTLDHYAKTIQLKRLDFIKIDVDGWDYDVIRGGEEVLRRFRPAFVMESNALHYRNHNASELFSYLDSLDYNCQPMDGINLMCTPKALR